jgi:hypothetical protein
MVHFPRIAGGKQLPGVGRRHVPGLSPPHRESVWEAGGGNLPDVRGIRGRVQLGEEREGGGGGEAGPNPHRKEAVGVRQPGWTRERRRPGRTRQLWCPPRRTWGLQAYKASALRVATVAMQGTKGKLENERINH